MGVRIGLSVCKFCGQPIKWVSERTSFGVRWIPLQMVPGKRGGFRLLKDSFGMTERHRCDLPQVRHFSETENIKGVFCGQRNGDGNTDYNGPVMSFSNDWSKVTCKNCLAKREFV